MAEAFAHIASGLVELATTLHSRGLLQGYQWKFERRC
jgi:hypothetical protein